MGWALLLLSMLQYESLQGDPVAMKHCHLSSVGGTVPYDPQMCCILLKWCCVFFPPQARVCSQLLSIVSPSCNISRKGFVIRCQLDMQACSDPGQRNCTCATLSEYSRQCAMSHEEVSDWRSDDFCCKLQEYLCRASTMQPKSSASEF